MLLLGIISLLFITKAEGGELLIVKSPPSVNFQGNEGLDQHLLAEISSVAMGFTPQQESDWQGMTLVDPFNFAEAVAVLSVDGIETLGKPSHFHKFFLNNDEDEFVTWNKIKTKVTDRYPVENNTLIRIELNDGTELNEMKNDYLNENVDEDADFLREITNLNKFMKKAKKSGGVADLYWFTMKSLHQLNDLKGPRDPSTVEAKTKVYESLKKLGEVFDKVYNGKALVMALVSDASHTRKTRSLSDNVEIVNINDTFKDNICDPDFPVIFNMILWFVVALVFSLLSVSVFIASMDPGRDSIIYRMTSTRIKKDS